MTGGNLYFRIKDNGATVLRIVLDEQKRRTNLKPVAQVNLRSGDIRKLGDKALSDDEQKEIAAWIDHRRDVLAGRPAEDLNRLVEQLGQATGWIKSVPQEDFDALADPLLWALHDLRSALIRRQSEPGD